MKIEFKVGDKVVVVYAPKREIGKFYNIGDVGIITALCSNGAYVDFNDQNNKEVYFTGVCLLQRECIRKCVEEKPRFHNAQVGDLLWNDDLGICKIKNIVDITECLFPITIRSDNGGDTITLEGKRGKNSPKATFFYYTPENNYLTERPEPEVDWSKVPRNTQVAVSSVAPPTGNGSTWSFFGYFPELEYPYWVWNDDTKNQVSGFYFCKIVEPIKPEWRK